MALPEVVKFLGKDRNSRGQMTTSRWFRFSQEAHGIDADAGDFVGTEFVLEVVMFAR